MPWQPSSRTSRRPSPPRRDNEPVGYGVGGAPPARSALTLRLVLATIGLISCGAGSAWAAVADTSSLLAVLLGLFALVAAIDIAVILRRKRRGEPG